MQEQFSGLLSAMAQFRYVEKKIITRPFSQKPAVHSEFLRTGRINRNRPNWDAVEKRVLTYEEVAERTGKYLSGAGEKTHERLNSFHESIKFPKLIFHRTIKGSPHLGYCHVTAAKTSFAEFKDVRWSFYIANFVADIETEELMFENINLRAERMYFAVAIQKDEENNKLSVNRAVRGDGLLFRTQDPKEALKNVLMLGAKHEALRKIIRAL